jgi:putative phosphoesterase
MRIAVIADIHGNFRALEAVREDIARRSPDVVVNLGDHLSGPLQAAATADLLMTESYINIRGNHDRQLTDRPPSKMGASDGFAHAQLTTRHLDWLASLPPTQILEDQVFMCHGSPRSDLEYLLEDVKGDCVRLSSPDQILPRLAGVNASLILCGHTHIPRAVLRSGAAWIVNPGSVGLQAYDDTTPCLHYMEVGSPHARYAIIDWSPKTINVDFIALDYDWNSAARDAAKADRPDWAHALANGYALRS